MAHALGLRNLRPISVAVSFNFTDHSLIMFNKWVRTKLLKKVFNLDVCWCKLDRESVHWGESRRGRVLSVGGVTATCRGWCTCGRYIPLHTHIHTSASMLWVHQRVFISFFVRNATSARLRTQPWNFSLTRNALTPSGRQSAACNGQQSFVPGSFSVERR